MDYLKAFVIGGAICMLGQVLIDLTRLTPARILVCYVVLGVILGGAGVYEKLVEFAGAGATVPLTGFGNTLAKGVREAVQEQGILGALTGGLEMAVSSSPNLTWVVPSLMVFDLPYITSVKYQKNLYEALDNGELGRYFKGKFNEVGLEPIMYCEYGYRDFFSVKKPIRSVGDLAGIQVRTTASAVEVEVAKALGMKPKPLAWGETYTALKEGIVEGEGNTFSFLLDAEHEDILKYAFASQHNYSMQILSANKKWWEELDPQVRSIIREAAAEALKYQREVLAPQSEEEAVKRFMADGLEVSKPSEAELEELKRKTRPVWNLFSDTLSQELIDLVVATQQ